MFGPYGRPRALLGLCKAPFNRHEGVTGDLSECSGGDAPVDQASVTADPQGESEFLANALAAHEAMANNEELVDGSGLFIDLQVELFGQFVQHKLGRGLAFTFDSEEYLSLMEVRRDVEIERLEAEEEFAVERNIEKFAARFNELSLRFQEETASILSEDEYRLLLDQDPDDHIVLADPEILAYAYRADPKPPRFSP